MVINHEYWSIPRYEKYWRNMSVNRQPGFTIDDEATATEKNDDKSNFLRLRRDQWFSILFGVTLW